MSTLQTSEELLNVTLGRCCVQGELFHVGKCVNLASGEHRSHRGAEDHLVCCRGDSNHGTSPLVRRPFPSLSLPPVLSGLASMVYSKNEHTSPGKAPAWRVGRGWRVKASSLTICLGHRGQLHGKSPGCERISSSALNPGTQLLSLVFMNCLLLSWVPERARAV